MPSTSSPPSSPAEGSPSIFKLPEELLVQIFLCYADDCDDASTYLRWTRVLFVCKQWRGIGLNCPSLWRTVYYHRREDCTREVLRRSQDMTLDICIPSFDPQTNDAAKILLEQAVRAKTLDLDVPLSTIDSLEEVTSQLTGVPHLKRMALLFRNDDGLVSGLSVTPLFPYGFPCLTSLDLTVENNIRKLPLLPNLRRLIIEGHPFKDGEGYGTWGICLVNLLDVLKNAPYLDTLEIFHLQPLVAVESSQNIPEVKLSALRRLALLGYARTMSQFLKHLRVPTTAQLIMQFEIEIPQDLTALLENLPFIFCGLNPQGHPEQRTLRTLFLTTPLDVNWQISFQGDTVERGEYVHEDTPDFEEEGRICLDLRTFTWKGPGEWRFDRLVHILPMAEVTTLTVEGTLAWRTFLPEVMDYFFPRGETGLYHAPPDAPIEWYEVEWRKIFPRLWQVRWRSLAVD
ncbi:F-box protein [Phanerochaete sordida]|uniref:F-box protein n=1 Tax=Phanerochaete sordida TaxID=48140 RepID=A0A9P3GHI7_9APHY|nr:F-box protein [Phanerochaete sordida]